MKNYQKIIITKKCMAGDDETHCTSYKHGSHGNCEYRGSGSDYEACHRPKKRKEQKDEIKGFVDVLRYEADLYESAHGKYEW